MKKNTLQVVISRDKEGYYIADIPLLKHCTSYGNTIEEAMYNIQEAAQGVLETMISEGLKIPINIHNPISYTYTVHETPVQLTLA